MAPPGGRPLCSPLPARPCASVPGSKIFTQSPAAELPFPGKPIGLFAPRPPLALIPPFRGAKSSHNLRPLGAVSPAIRPASLLPVPREALFLRSGEQNLHTISGRRAPFPRQTNRSLCSPTPASPYSSVPGSKIFTQSPAARRSFAGNPAGLFAPRSPRGLIPPFRGAKSSHNRRPPSALSPEIRPASLLPTPR